MTTTELLKNYDLKITHQRIAILDYLLENKNHPTVETIYQDLSNSHPALSLATVYKSLATFRDKGLVMEFNMGDDCFRYDGDIVPHSHFKCEKCNKIFDLFNITTSQTLKDEIENLGHTVTNTQFLVYGTCSSCKNKF